jgi:hypothetical protein
MSSSKRSLVALTLLGAFVSGCGGPRPPESESSARTGAVARPAPAAREPRAPLLPPEQPLTPAEFVLLTDDPLFASELGREMVALGPGKAGFVDAKRRRAIATLAGVRHYDGAGQVEEICLASDGKTTFVVGAQKHVTSVFRGDTFEGPVAPLGKRLTARYTNVLAERAWVVSDERGTFLVECASGSVSRLGEPATGADTLSWSDALAVVRIHRDKQVECLLRTGDRWNSLPACDVRSQADGSIVIETRNLTPRPGQKPRCLKAFSADGKNVPCGTKVGAPVTSTPWQAEAIQWEHARYFAPRRVAVPTHAGDLVELTRTPVPADARRLSPADLGDCKPVLPTAPLFRCSTDDGTTVMARLDRDGAFREELRRGFSAERRDVFHVTVDGGVALGGTCDGALEQAACVRRPDGSFHTVRFSPELVAALTRTAPMTKLVPTREGELYVGLGALEGGLTGRVSIKLFKADAGPGVAVENVPTWMLGSLGGIGELLLVGATAPWELTDALSLSYSRADRIRLWPFARRHPAFGSSEICRIDLTLQGAFDVACEQGRLYHAGRVGLLQKRADELEETLDAGGSWTKVSVPSGLEIDALHCNALGCRVGPYFRRGWGPPAPG